MKLKITSFSLKHPWIVMGLALGAAMFFGAQFPKVKFDNDPENMLAEDEHIRVFHNSIKEKYNLYDFVIVGIVNKSHENGVFNVETLGRIDELTRELISLHRNEDGLPEVTRKGKPFTPTLQPDSAWKRALAGIFKNDTNRLFDENGDSVIIKPEIISPGVVDNIKQAGPGELAIEYLMEEAPETAADAARIQRDAMNNPLYRGTLVSEDSRAIALYIPITAKIYSYNVANLIEKLTEHWSGDDQIYITGQPVAQDTFGVEMLVQMATSAPLAGLAIFLLLLFFFRRISLIIAPMIVAIVSVVATMGLLIGLGFNVHIMSSMIAIFLMPISVADSVHILSEFYDTYPQFRDKSATVKHVVGHLFYPMLYTSLTTIAGFASLGTTPIPPVRVFGLHVAFGVGLAWLLTMTLVPAYIMLFVRTETLDKLRPETKADDKPPKDGFLTRHLGRIGSLSYAGSKFILILTGLIMIISVYGISKIRVNDNPVKWFTEKHRIRIADRVLNNHFGGTYTAYLTFRPENDTSLSYDRKLALTRQKAEQQFDNSNAGKTEFLKLLEDSLAEYRKDRNQGHNTLFTKLNKQAEELDAKTNGIWLDFGDEINYLEPDKVTLQKIKTAVTSIGSESERAELFKALAGTEKISGAVLQEKALDFIDSRSKGAFAAFLNNVRAEIEAPLFKRPGNLAWLEQLQEHMKTLSNVGKTSSAVDALKKASYELNYIANAGEERNRAFYSIPPSASAVGQVFTQLEGMKKKDSLFHLVTKDYSEANLWVQMKNGDNTEMQAVVNNVEKWINNNQAPVKLQYGWAGLTYLNVVWQEKMVSGMLNALLSSFVVVLIMMIVLFRSFLFGLLAMLPLTVTITFIYGLIGLVGKDYDMPVAVLSSLTLGLSVDFAIHFLERARELTRTLGSWKKAIEQMFKEPAMAISRNAIVISIGFTPLLFAPLVPYKTVGFFLATIMAVSWLATLFILAAIITALQKKLFKET